MTPYLRPRPLDDPAVRLVVFHHAGGSASAYFPLLRELPADWDLLLLDLPGRGRRHQVAPLEDMAQLVMTATDDLRSWTQQPFALFGHSLGAVLAAEVARSLQGKGAHPVWVGVSGRPAPENDTGRHTRPDLSDRELMRQLTEMGGIPARLNELPEFADRMLRLVRSDLRAVDSYTPDPGRVPLTAPLTAFAATDDAWAPPAAVAGWARETRGGFNQRLFSGGHFHFLGAAFAAFTRALVGEIQRVHHPAGAPAGDPDDVPGRAAGKPD